MRAEAGYEPDPLDAYDDYYESGWYEDDTEYRVILIQNDYLLDVARNDWRVALTWYISRMGLRRGLPSIGVATERDGYERMQTAQLHAFYAQEWVSCQTDEPIA